MIINNKVNIKNIMNTLYPVDIFTTLANTSPSKGFTEKVSFSGRTFHKLEFQ